MKTSISKTFEVLEKPSVVWNYLINPQDIVECVPGVSIQEKMSNNSYKGQVSMKFGPVGVNYDAEIIYDDIDETNQKIIIIGKGVDSRGKGNAEMKMDLDLSANDTEGTKVVGLMDVTINGKIAQFGARIIHDVSNHLFKKFVANFTKKLEGQQLTDRDQRVNTGGVLKSVVKGVFKSKEES